MVARRILDGKPRRWLVNRRSASIIALNMPILDERSLDFISHSPEQTQRFGVRFGELLRPGDVILLRGDLGAGKTTLAQGIARGWGAIDAASSPTFVLINEYRRADNARLVHLDAFRLGSGAEIELLGLDDLFDRGDPIMIEWPERLEGFLPEQGLTAHLRWVDDSRRSVHLQADGVRYDRLLRQFRQSAFGS
jgi:tRNA threonylcarbamoyladenosine biosynthesis protein TsaE